MSQLDFVKPDDLDLCRICHTVFVMTSKAWFLALHTQYNICNACYASYTRFAQGTQCTQEVTYDMAGICHVIWLARN